jgi:hypothetical protein
MFTECHDNETKYFHQIEVDRKGKTQRQRRSRICSRFQTPKQNHQHSIAKTTQIVF